MSGKRNETNLRDLKNLKNSVQNANSFYEKNTVPAKSHLRFDKIDSIVTSEDFSEKLNALENYIYHSNFEFSDFVNVQETLNVLENYKSDNYLLPDIIESFEKIKLRIFECRKKNMVYIPGREIRVGSLKNKNESPPFFIFVNSFYIDKFPVSVREFLNYLPQKKENLSSFNFHDEPARGISWIDANEFCMKAGKRLPTEAEWISAAYGLECSEYSTGKNKNTLKKAALSQTKQWPGFRLSSPAFSNNFGVYHLTGMLWEWTADNYFLYKSNHTNDPTANGKNKVLKGGCWKSNPDELRNNYRYSCDPFISCENIGFRCALSI